MMEVNSEELRKAVERLHNCHASHKESVRVQEKFMGQIAWDGIVEVFEIDHPVTDICYAGQLLSKGRSKFYAVLKVPPIDSPQRAVRVSIVKDWAPRGRDGISS